MIRLKGPSPGQARAMTARPGVDPAGHAVNGLRLQISSLNSGFGKLPTFRIPGRRATANCTALHRIGHHATQIVR